MPESLRRPRSVADSRRPGSTAEPARTQGQRAEFIYHRLLASCDLLTILLAGAVAVYLASQFGRTMDVGILALTLALMSPLWLLIAYGAGLYHEVERRIDHSYVDEIGPITIASTAWCWLFVMGHSLLASGATSLLIPALLWLLMIPSLLLSRSILRQYVNQRPWNVHLVATVGDDEDVEFLTKRIERHPEWGLDVRLAINLGPTSRYEPHSLAGIISSAGIERVMLAGGIPDLAFRTRLVQELAEREIAVDMVSGGPESLYSTGLLQSVEGTPIFSVRPTSPQPIARKIKRFTDIVISLSGLCFLSPLLLWAAIRIKLDSKGPVLYRQVRCGLDGREFKLLKLRTMVDGAHEMRPGLRRETVNHGNDDVLFKLEDDPRITKVGRSLRLWSLDELPQLWNVLVGEMSMVGPRPLVYEEALQATDLFAARSRVRPGIAGPWQALGRSNIPFDDMIRLDYSYVTGWSMTEDMKLLLKTVTAVIKKRGAR